MKANLDNPAISGFEVGSIGGGVYKSETIVIRIGNFEPAIQIAKDAYEKIERTIETIIRKVENLF